MPKYKTDNIKLKIVLWILFSAYVFFILSRTLLFRSKKFQEPMLELFWSYKQWLLFGSSTLGKEILLNILLFVPYGFILCFLVRPKNVIPSALLFSATIEVAQLLLRLGLFEFDDILNNTLGAAIGLGLSCIISFFLNHKNTDKHAAEE